MHALIALKGANQKLRLHLGGASDSPAHREKATELLGLELAQAAVGGEVEKRGGELELIGLPGLPYFVLEVRVLESGQQLRNRGIQRVADHEVLSLDDVTEVRGLVGDAVSHQLLQMAHLDVESALVFTHHRLRLLHVVEIAGITSSIRRCAEVQEKLQEVALHIRPKLSLHQGVHLRKK